MKCPQCQTEMVKAKASSYGEEYDYCRICKKELSEMQPSDKVVFPNGSVAEFKTPAEGETFFEQFMSRWKNSVALVKRGDEHPLIVKNPAAGHLSMGAITEEIQKAKSDKSLVTVDYSDLEPRILNDLAADEKIVVEVTAADSIWAVASKTRSAIDEDTLVKAGWIRDQGYWAPTLNGQVCFFYMKNIEDALAMGSGARWGLITIRR